MTFDGTISGSGAVQLNGAGKTILTATNTYSGTTTVNAGTLAVNGSIAASSVTVNSGATIGGIGTLGPTTIKPGGTLAPGNPIGAITIAGNLSFVGAGNYIVETSGPSTDKTVVTGMAALSGAVLVVPLSFVTRKITYTILTSAGLSGTFGRSPCRTISRAPRTSAIRVRTCC